MPNTLDLAKALIARPSVSPHDAGCQELLIERLSQLGFTIERLRFGDVDNLWARRGTDGPVFAFAGHTDVVPPGPLEYWDSDPFAPEVREGMLYGRGAADMKGSLAAMITACENFITAHPKHAGSIAFLITSDEEAEARDGTVKVIEHLEARQEKIDWCLVGEPSSDKHVGDTIKNGRRGSLHGYLTVQGKQGHVAYAHLADNPIHRAMTVLDKLCQITWDEGDAFFPATGFQISNISGGAGANNVIPGMMQAQFNLRFSAALTPDDIKQRVNAVMTEHNVNHELQWHLSGNPFITPSGALVDAAREAINEIMKIDPTLSTAGGTSDGRFIAPTGAQVLELGPCNETIHQINECVSVEDLDSLAVIYEQILMKLLTD